MKQFLTPVGLLSMWMTLGFQGCVSDPSGSVRICEAGQANFVLYVSNQSLTLRNVDLEIRVDGRVLIAEDFDVGEGEDLAHNWKTFYLDVPDGAHELRAVSRKGDARLEHPFVMQGKRWAVIDYWFKPASEGGGEPKSIKIDIQDKPITFM